MNALEKSFRECGSLAEAVSGALSHSDDEYEYEYDRNEKYENRNDVDVFDEVAELLAPDFKSIVERKYTKNPAYVDVVLNEIKAIPKGRLKLKQLDNLASMLCYAIDNKDDYPAKTTMDANYNAYIKAITSKSVTPMTLYNITKFDKDDLLDISPELVKYYIDDAKMGLKRTLADAILFGQIANIGMQDHQDGSNNSVNANLFSGDHIDSMMNTAFIRPYEISSTSMVRLSEDLALNDLTKNKINTFIIDNIRTIINNERRYNNATLEHYERLLNQYRTVLGPSTIAFLDQDLYYSLLNMKDDNGKYIYPTSYSIADAIGVSQVFCLDVGFYIGSTIDYGSGYSSEGYSYRYQKPIVYIVDPGAYYLGVEKESEVDHSYDIDYNQETVNVYGRYSGMPGSNFRSLLITTPKIDDAYISDELFNLLTEESVAPMNRATNTDKIVKAINDLQATIINQGNGGES